MEKLKMNNKKWFIEKWQLDNFLILDTETTGLSQYDEILQIGIINKEGEILLDELVRPAVPIGAGAAKVHGITKNDVADCPSLSDMFWQLHDVVEGKNIFVYNAPFDKRILQQSLHQAELNDLTKLCTWHDVMNPYAQFWHDSRGRWQSLTKACAQQGIEIVDAHSAVGDCQMTLALMKKLAT